jgi:hypothetical protein
LKDTLLQPYKENILLLQTWNFFTVMRVIFALLYPDPDPAD